METIQKFREAIDREKFLSASKVQGFLLDLYGEHVPAPAKGLLETWLTLTIERNLFAVDELSEMLDEFERLATVRN